MGQSGQRELMRTSWSRRRRTDGLRYVRQRAWQGVGLSLSCVEGCGTCLVLLWPFDVFSNPAVELTLGVSRPKGWTGPDDIRTGRDEAEDKDAIRMQARGLWCKRVALYLRVVVAGAGVDVGLICRTGDQTDAP